MGDNPQELQCDRTLETLKMSRYCHVLCFHLLFDRNAASFDSKSVAVYLVFRLHIMSVPIFSSSTIENNDSTYPISCFQFDLELRVECHMKHFAV
jgi:hypothetical protein